MFINKIANYKNKIIGNSRIKIETQLLIRQLKFNKK